MLGAQVSEAPGSPRHHAPVRPAPPRGAVREHQLQMLAHRFGLQSRAAGLTAQPGQGMIGRSYSGQLDLRHSRQMQDIKLTFAGDNQADIGLALDHGIARRAQAFDLQPCLDRRKALLKRPQNPHEPRHGKHGLDHQRQFGFQARLQTFRDSAKCARRLQHRLGSGQERAPRLGQARAIGGAVEQADARLQLKILNGVGYGRLGPAQGARGGGETALGGHHREDAQLIKGGLSHSISLSDDHYRNYPGFFEYRLSYMVFTEVKKGFCPMAVLPSLFIPHGGGPCFFMDPPPSHPHLWDGMEAYLRGVIASLPERPKAILMISGHWETEVPTLNVQARPQLLFDYYGFPEHTYRLTYDAPGAPDLALRVEDLLTQAGFETRRDEDRGWDHGVFIPLMVMAPEADIPVLQLSLLRDLDPARHMAMGKALAPLREEGVLIVGSGMSYHNLRQMFSPQGAGEAQAFDDWLNASLEQPKGREEALAHWAGAPGARASHPREEHLIPLMVAAGASPQGLGSRPYNDHILGKAISAFHFA